MATSRAESTALLAARSLAFPQRDTSLSRSLSFPAPASLAVLLVCLTFLLSNLASYKAGRLMEQRTQLGYLVAAAPALEDLTAATRFQDSVAMQFVIQMERLRRQR